MIIPCLSDGGDHDIVTEVKSTSSTFKFTGADDAKGMDEYCIVPFFIEENIDGKLASVKIFPFNSFQ